MAFLVCTPLFFEGVPILSLLTFQAILSEEVDKLVDEWSLRQIAQGNTDTRFLNANRDQRIEMMSNGMFEETDDEKLVRHPSEELEIYIVENGDETSTWTPLIGAQADANDEESSSFSTASAPHARPPVSNWVLKWVHTDHTEEGSI